MNKKYVVTILLVSIITAMIIAFMAASTSAQIYPSGMVSYWKFDEESGITAIDSVGTNHGAISGATRTEGLVKNALSFDPFDGTRNFVNLNKTFSEILVNTRTFTIEAWFYTQTKNEQQSIIADGLGNSSLGIYLEKPFFAPPEGKLIAAMTYSDGQIVLPRMDYSASIWNHIVFSDDGTTMECYMNGMLKSATDSSYIEGNIAANLGTRIGINALGTDNYPFNGIIDEVAIYNRALTIDEIQQHYQNGLQGQGYEALNRVPLAVAGTSLDGNNLLQLDGTLSTDADGDLLTYSWQINGGSPLSGQIVSIAYLAVGNYTVTLTVSDGTNNSAATMLLGVPSGAGEQPPTPDELQIHVIEIKDFIVGLGVNCFDAPNDRARENRRRALLNMIDKVYDSIGIEDFQAAIDQLRDVFAKSDGLEPPESAPDWIICDDASIIAQSISDLIDDILVVCSECN